MPSCGGRCKTLGNLSPSTCLSSTSSCLACTLGGPKIEITATATLEYDDPKHAVKSGAPEHGAIEYNVLGFDADGFDFGALNNDTLELKEPSSETSFNVRVNPNDWDPGGGQVKPQDFHLVAWWG